MNTTLAGCDTQPNARPDHSRPRELDAFLKTGFVHLPAPHSTPVVVAPDLEPTLVCKDDVRDLIRVRQHPLAEFETDTDLIARQVLHYLGGL